MLDGDEVGEGDESPVPCVTTFRGRAGSAALARLRPDVLDFPLRYTPWGMTIFHNMGSDSSVGRFGKSAYVK